MVPFSLLTIGLKNEIMRSEVKMNPFSPFDELDYKILLELRKNARMPASEIARVLDENERKIRKRIDRLVEMNIGKFTVVMDPKMFGYGIYVDIFLEIDPAREAGITETLLQIRELSFLANGQESDKMSIEAYFKTTEGLYAFLRETLPSIDGIKKIDYALIPRMLKDTYDWMPPPENFGVNEE